MSERDQYCPIYASLDLFGDRWGLLVIREILRGVTRFNELERSLPGISRSTLSQRLRHLEKAGLIERHVGADVRSTQYEATAAGSDLGDVIDAVGAWGVRWLVPRRPRSAIDPEGLMQWVSRHVVLRALPERRVVIRFELLGRGRRFFWLVLRTGEASLCPEHPGFPEDVHIAAKPQDLYLVVTGKVSWEDARDLGVIRAEGPPAILGSLPTWLILRESGPVMDDERAARRHDRTLEPLPSG